MAEQLKLPFDAISVTYPSPRHYQTITSIVNVKVIAQQRAEVLNTAYATIMQGLKQFREKDRTGVCKQKVQK